MESGEEEADFGGNGSADGRDSGSEAEEGVAAKTEECRTEAGHDATLVLHGRRLVNSPQVGNLATINVNAKEFARCGQDLLARMAVVINRHQDERQKEQEVVGRMAEIAAVCAGAAAGAGCASLTHDMKATIKKEIRKDTRREKQRLKRKAAKRAKRNQKDRNGRDGQHREDYSRPCVGRGSAEREITTRYDTEPRIQGRRREDPKRAELRSTESGAGRSKGREEGGRVKTRSPSPSRCEDSRRGRYREEFFRKSARDEESFRKAPRHGQGGVGRHPAERRSLHSVRREGSFHQAPRRQDTKYEESGGRSKGRRGMGSVVLVSSRDQAAADRRSPW